jgi:hypothetical protein
MLVACGERTPSTDAERLAKGREIVSRMSDKLGSAKAFTVRTTEVRDQVRPGGQTQTVKLTREMVVQRPDRFYFKTSGDSPRRSTGRSTRFTNGTVLCRDGLPGRGASLTEDQRCV